MQIQKFLAVKRREITITAVVVLGLISIVGSGGPSYIVRPTDSGISEKSNSHYSAILTPKCSDGECKGFTLVVHNNTNKDLEIDWNKTLYVANGTTSGGFMFEGIVYAQRNAPKAPDMVFAKGVFQKTIWPTSLVEYSSGRYGGWRHEGMPPGENGIYLTVRSGSEEIREKVTVNLRREQIKR